MEEQQISEIAKALGSRGGNKTLKTHGKEHFRKIARKRWNEKKKEDKN